MTKNVETHGRDYPSPRTNPNTGMAQLGGIWCPWNKDETGPAKMPGGVFCLVWKSWDDFNENASPNNFHFCRKICNYGHLEATKRHNVERSRNAFHARRYQQNVFAKKLKEQFKLKFPQLQVRAIAPWKHHVKPKVIKPQKGRKTR